MSQDAARSDPSRQLALSSRMLFVNLPVRELARSVLFFRALGFEFDARFSDAQGACMIVTRGVRVMLLSEPFFRSFTERQICDTEQHTESLFALTCESRAEVDELLGRALAGGARAATRTVDRGFLYHGSFYDLDGHQWEVLWMNPARFGCSTLTR